MTNNTKSKRETLWEEDDFFQQQSPYLQALGVNRAADAGEGETADFLYDLDLHVHDEAERLFSGFAANMKRAPTAVVSLLADTQRLGMKHSIGLEFTALVAAYVHMRISAGGSLVREKHGRICAYIGSSQNYSCRKERFDRYCREMARNNRDLVTEEEISYHCGDPIKPVKPAVADEPKGSSPLAEALLAQVLDATQGWSAKRAFGCCWSQWPELWRMLLERDDVAGRLRKRNPASFENKTGINIRLVCNVAGLVRDHLREKKDVSLTNKHLAELIQKAWASGSSRNAISETAELARLTGGLVELIREWLSTNVK